MLSRRSPLISVLVVASLVALSGAAQAVVREVSIKNQFFCCTNPNLFIAGAPQGKKGYHTVRATAYVTNYSAGPGGPIKIGMGRAAHFHSMKSTPFSVGTFSVSNASATFKKSGGNNQNFSFCPKYVGLPIPGPGCTHPGKATPSYQGWNGQVKVTPGPNKFGGTMQILAGPGGIGGTKFSVYRLIGPMLTQLPAQIVSGGIKASPIGAAPPGQFAVVPQPQMTGYPPDFDSMSFPDAKLWVQGAGPFTTGFVTLRVTMQPGQFPNRSVMLRGYDNRSPMGLGNVQLVSGAITNQYDGPEPGAWPIGWKMRIMFIPEPAANLGLVVGALALLWVGSLRARSGARRGE